MAGGTRAALGPGLFVATSDLDSGWILWNDGVFHKAPYSFLKRINDENDVDNRVSVPVSVLRWVHGCPGEVGRYLEPGVAGARDVERLPRGRLFPDPEKP